MSVVLALKLALVPLLIAGVTLAGRRWGPSVAGWLSAFPVISAPILLFITLEQGTTFAASAAVGTLSAVLAILIFGITYAWVATRFSWAISLIASFISYFATVTCLNFWQPSLLIASLAVFIALLIAPMLFPVLPVLNTNSSGRTNDIYWRMAAGAVLVVVVTNFSSRLGPQLSGIFAMFPIMSSVLVVFSHQHSGVGFAVNMLRGMVFGYFSFSIFCVVLSFTLSSMGIAASFLLALASAVFTQVISRVCLRRPQQQPSRPAP